MIFLHTDATAIAQQLCIDLPSRPNLTPTISPILGEPYHSINLSSYSQSPQSRLLTPHSAYYFESDEHGKTPPHLCATHFLPAQSTLREAHIPTPKPQEQQRSTAQLPHRIHPPTPPKSTPPPTPIPKSGTRLTDRQAYHGGGGADPQEPNATPRKPPSCFDRGGPASLVCGL